MPIQKVKTLSVQDNRRIVIQTEISNGHRTIVLNGEPFVEVQDTFVQIGCMRIGRDVIEALHDIMQVVESGTIIQDGNYKVKDPRVKLDNSCQK